MDEQIKEMLWAIPQFEKLEDYELAAELEKAIKQLIAKEIVKELENINDGTDGEMCCSVHHEVIARLKHYKELFDEEH